MKHIIKDILSYIYKIIIYCLIFKKTKEFTKVKVRNFIKYHFFPYGNY